MSSGTFIAEAALQEIGAHSLAAPAPPDVIEKTTIRLGSMLQRWLSWGIKLDITPLNAPGDEVGEPADSTEAIIFNLALDIAGPFSNGTSTTVSPDLRRNARITLAQVKQIYRKLIVPPRQISSTTPRGQGNVNGLRSRVFFDQEEPLSG